MKRLLENNKMKLKNGRTICSIEDGKVYVNQRYFKRIKEQLYPNYKHFVILDNQIVLQS